MGGKGNKAHSQQPSVSGGGTCIRAGTPRSLRGIISIRHSDSSGHVRPFGSGLESESTGSGRQRGADACWAKERMTSTRTHLRRNNDGDDQDTKLGTTVTDT